MKKLGVIGAITASLIVTTAIVLLSLFAFWAATNISKPEPQVSSVTDQSIVDYVNVIRKENGVQPLREDTGLNETAKLKADDMALRNYWDHTTPDGIPFQVLLLQKRPGLKFYGENLAECFTTNESTVAGWKASPGHFKNMIEPRFNIIGSYTVWDQDKGCAITVNHFGEESAE